MEVFDMLPVMNRNLWMPEEFNDFFDTDFMPRVSATAPAINVKESEKDYTVELAAPGLTRMTSMSTSTTTVTCTSRLRTRATRRMRTRRATICVANSHTANTSRHCSFLTMWKKTRSLPA